MLMFIMALVAATYAVATVAAVVRIMALVAATTTDALEAEAKALADFLDLLAEEDEISTLTHAGHHRRRNRKGDKADHLSRKAAYAALRGPHDSHKEWRRDFDNLERLTKYGEKHLGDYYYVAKVMSCNRGYRLAYGRGYDPYVYGDRFAKPVRVEKARAAAALEDTEVFPEDIGSIWDKKYEDVFDVYEECIVDDHGDEILVDCPTNYWDYFKNEEVPTRLGEVINVTA